ncbi:chemotaxis protein CheD [Leptospira meyeri]|uniref:Probable chemoreceptor glutamine deamidase CheD n=1 Tax=Leptospira meyeri TaxID=29508 RepID=A0A4R8MM14_LEPME|nr:chemotaxis protein CheD [Leptospira meyeri]EKJ86817.1 CheD chemotactic sensory transduction [Leptospira meyeri serovar Hardjo str. Went 5]EMJ90072.1 chemotactic sensory transduction protein CheD [Leptospira meyeri serovar Semaranga str. Veldrot Semarang 173]TDY67997.1 chemotaxis protein CheD [Leptospira meyeri]TGL51949.1 chemotaxis protein CheD [Leptospira meyeri]
MCLISFHWTGHFVMKQKVYLNIGEAYFTSGIYEIRTILGSCVSVCLFHERTKHSAINHILLPGSLGKLEEKQSLRYGITSMELLINEFVKLNIPRNELKAKIFGGSQTLKLTTNNAGPKNIMFVKDFLQTEKIPIISEDTGGELYRKLVFHTDNYDVFITKLQPNVSTEILTQERHFETKVRERMVKKTSVFTF